MFRVSKLRVGDIILSKGDHLKFEVLQITHYRGIANKWFAKYRLRRLDTNDVFETRKRALITNYMFDHTIRTLYGTN